MIESTSIKDLINKFYSDDIARYVQILPTGVNLGNGQINYKIEGEVLSFSPARTRYENHQPVCRSLDSIQTIHKDCTCSSCLLRKNCTPQIRLDIIHSSGVLRFLLSYTSLRNFMLFLSTLEQQKITLEGAMITINVLNRGRWGELKFHLKAKNTTAHS